MGRFIRVYVRVEEGCGEPDAQKMWKWTKKWPTMSEWNAIGYYWPVLITLDVGGILRSWPGSASFNVLLKMLDGISIFPKCQQQIGEARLSIVFNSSIAVEHLVRSTFCEK